VSLVDALARIAEINELLAPPGTAPPAPSGTSAQAFSQLLAPLAEDDESTDTDSFASGLDLASLGLPLGIPASTAPQFQGGGSAGQRALAVAQTQVGQAETPPGANDGPAIATYRTATAGAYAGAPWCAYFVSWAFAQAGMPLGEEGQGYGAVEQIHDWAARTGRLLPAGALPQPGDIVLYGGRHVGIVESVNADGSLNTVEGNYQHSVGRVHRSPSEATGFVRV
jgi:hypothetical protein